MDLAKKLQLRPGQGVEVTGIDAGSLPVLGDLATAEGPEAALLAFVTDRAVLGDHLTDVVTAAAADRLTWVAYPKSGQLGTDLNRDVLAALLTDEGVRPVRQVAIDDVWSALRFRPG
jgi:hypothetical protein